MFSIPSMQGSLSEVAVGSQVYVTPVESIGVDVHNSRVSMVGEVVLVLRGSILIKGLTSGKRPVVISKNSAYRIDAGASPIPTERMRGALHCILSSHQAKLRELGINNEINESDYFMRDALDCDTFGDLEGGVNPCGILEPFSLLSWCVYHDVQSSVNTSRSLIATRFGALTSSSIPHLPSDGRSNMKNLGTQPKPTDIVAAANAQHPLLSQHIKSEVAYPQPGDISESLSHLNPSQVAAVGITINECRQLTLIQGPPGTGKTTTAIATITEWVKHRKGLFLTFSCLVDSLDCQLIFLFNIPKTGNILATAHSNAGVDNLMEGLLRRGVRCLRVGRSSSAALDEHSLETVLREDPSNHRRQMIQIQVCVQLFYYEEDICSR